MPRSRRDKEISLTKVKKKTRETKVTLVDEIRSCVDSYKNVLVFTIENMRSTKFVGVRQNFKQNSRFFFGKNNVMAIALGRKADDEYAEELHKISECLKGQCGLMFTNAEVDDVLSFFKTYVESDFARSGNEATEDVSLPQGPLPQFAHSIEPQLRKLGMPTKLERGIVTLYEEFGVCKEGDKLTADQARILKLLDVKMTPFQVVPTAHWTKADGFKLLA
ncbi:hypothetical protein L596_020324 [Steinernema carpocapsae]|uniref:Ribosome assembly factor mrt4 n=1 Tax=Steinernema carpocapsae TaxID=34508 RepID=A0A4U5MTC6_STECR|nr:hypothetical protein L596_020324 [Steinernema carpocapsae]